MTTPLPSPTSLSGYDLNSLGPLCRPHHIDYIESPPLHTVDLTFNCLPIQKGGGMGEGGHWVYRPNSFLIYSSVPITGHYRTTVIPVWRLRTKQWDDEKKAVWNGDQLTHSASGITSLPLFRCRHFQMTEDPERTPVYKLSQLVKYH